MNHIIFHEINSQDVETILREGIKRQSDGDKTDSETKKIDIFLDTHIPEDLSLPLSRQTVIYGYMSDGEKIQDISTGGSIKIEEYKPKDGATLLQIEVDPTKCYVSDLDLYDTLRRAMELKEQDSTLENLAEQYWRKIVPLGKYDHTISTARK